MAKKKDDAVTLRYHKVAFDTTVMGNDKQQPMICAGSHTGIYPWTVSDWLTKKLEKRKYQFVTLENEFLKVDIVPDLGGHISQATDKITGEDFFHSPPKLQYGLILLRGFWTNLGVEFNFPRGHTVNSFETVDHTTIEKADGTKGVVVGLQDKMSRMYWQVTISLTPGERRFRVDVLLLNGTNRTQRWYFWQNAGGISHKDVELIAPTKYAYGGWGKKTISIPEEDGDDIRYICRDGGVGEYFLYNRDTYFGYHDHSRDFGVLHTDDPDQVKGNKFFHWGVGPSSDELWKEILGHDHCYFEFQTGPLHTQHHYEFMGQGDQRVFHNYWLPNTLFPVDAANHAGALKFKNGKKGLKIEFSPMVNMEDWKITVISKEGKSETISFSCKVGKIVEIDLPVVKSKEDIDLLQVTDTNEAEQLRWPKLKKELTLEEANEVVASSYVGPEAEKPENIFKDAVFVAQSGNYEPAEKLFKRLLKKKSGHTGALYHIGIMKMLSGLTVEAAKWFKKAIASKGKSEEDKNYKIEAGLELVQVNIEKEDYTAAKKMLVDLLEKKKVAGTQEDRSRILLAKLFSLKGSPDDALSTLDKIKRKRKSKL